ncbi:ABC transporter substrate-binding protein [Alicyclobacillus fodiniaquatilis]|uniref:ABC transporter substrate-binding protein n=1 Tax=Alicyclobacillus fodiniaquatilis TaxID=1661150 RepID=A0ABW4JJ46_9BACL
MKKKARRLAGTSLGLTVLSAGMLYGCGTPSGNQSGSGQSGSTGTITLNVATYEGQGTSLTDQHKIAQAYMKLHPNVKINIISIPSNYDQKIETEVAAGDAPDMFQIGDGDVSMYANKKSIINLSPLLAKNNVNLKAYYQSVLDTGKVNGQIYTMPKDWSDLAVYYNKKMFQAAHIPLPTANWTWAQLAADAKKLTITKNGKTTQWGVLLPGDSTREVEPIVFAYGGSIINPNGNSYTGYLNSKGTAAGLTEYQSIYNSGAAPSASTVNGFQGVDLFQAKKVAMEVSGDWPNANYKTTPGLSYGVAPLPAGPKGKANTICYSGWGISSQSKNQQAAFKYLEYLAGPKGEAQLTNYSLVSLPAVAKTQGQDNDPTLKGFLDGVPYIKPLPDLISPYWNASGNTQFQDVLDKMLANPSLDIQSTLNSAATAANSALQQAKAQD